MSALSVSDNKISFSGPVDFKTVTSLETKGISVIDHSTEQSLVVDLSGITSADSSALALMLSWRKQADKMSVSISFEGWSPALLRLAKLCGIDTLLACKD